MRAEIGHYWNLNRYSIGIDRLAMGTNNRALIEHFQNGRIVQSLPLPNPEGKLAC